MTERRCRGVRVRRRSRARRAGRFGRFGGRFVPEALVKALDELDAAYRHAMADEGFQAEFGRLLRDYVGVPSLLYDATRLSTEVGTRILLKREDLNHTGAHKIRNALGQALITKYMGKKRVIAETGAGQHGVATATAAALFGLECVVYMGEVDTERQALNVARMKMLGAKVVPVRTGFAHAEGRDQRGHPRLGHERRQHALHHRYGRRPAPVPGDGARLRAWHRRRGAPAVPRPDRRAARRGLRLRRRRLQRDRHLPRVHPRRERPALRLRAGRRRRRDRPARRHDHRGHRSACSRAPAATCCRTTTVRRSSRTRSRPASTTPASVRSTRG